MFDFCKEWLEFSQYCCVSVQLVSEWLIDRFYVESIASLRDIQTVEVFFLNAKQAIFKVSTFLRTVSNYFVLAMINELVTVMLFLEIPNS